MFERKILENCRAKGSQQSGPKSGTQHRASHMVAAVPDEDGLISGLSEDQLVTVDEIDALAKEVGVASRTTPPAYVPIPRLSHEKVAPPFPCALRPND